MSQPTERKKMKRGAVSREGSTFVGVWVPDDVVQVLEQAVNELDTDNSKFLRTALQEKLEREGFGQNEPQPA